MERRDSNEESRLWSYLSTGDGIRCPLYINCEARKKGEWCADDDGETFRQLIDSGDKFDPNNYESDWFKGYGDTEGVFLPVEKLAEKLLRAGGIQSPPIPISIASLADKRHPIEVQKLCLKNRHGALWYKDKRWVIQLKMDDSPATKRFTLFHEAFHIIAHCRANPVFRKMGAIRGSFNELLADYFSVCILMPQNLIEKKWAEFKELNKMAETFQVPEPVMWFRLKQLRLI